MSHIFNFLSVLLQINLYRLFDKYKLTGDTINTERNLDTRISLN